MLNSKFNNVDESLFCTAWEQGFVGVVNDPEILFSRFFNKILLVTVLNFIFKLKNVGLGIQV